MRSAIADTCFSLQAGIGLQQQMREVGGDPLWWLLLLPVGVACWLSNRRRVRAGKTRRSMPTPS